MPTTDTNVTELPTPTNFNKKIAIGAVAGIAAVAALVVLRQKLTGAEVVDLIPAKA